MSKPFSKDLHDKHDKQGRDAVKKLFKKLGYQVADNPDIYKIDLFIRNKYVEARVEVEHKACWKTRDFPYDTVYVPLRKEKNCRKDSLHAVVNNDCNTIIITHTNNILKAEKISRPNKYMKMETFYAVPFSLFEIHKVEEK